MAGLLKVPLDLTRQPLEQKHLKLNGLTVVESCTHAVQTAGSMFLEEHLLLFILKGSFHVTFGEEEYFLKKNEMVLLKKAISVEYTKSGDPEDDNFFEIMMFFLKDDFLKEFVRRIPAVKKNPDNLVPVTVKPADKRLLGFIESLKPFFDEPESINDELVKLKMQELLYDLGNIDHDLLRHLLILNRQTRNSISYIIDRHYTDPVSLSDLAYLSGRSLSGFKRDFKKIYKTPPLQLIREKRLEKALSLLKDTDMSVTDICFATGFENVSHFSRAFKQYFGYPPSHRPARIHK